MQKIIIIGNGAAGKSTLAQELSNILSIAHYDLDNYFWKNKRFKKSRSHKKIFSKVSQIANSESWIVEGVYSHIIKHIENMADVLIWLDLPIDECMENLITREVKPLEFQVSRTREYYERQNGSSRESHKVLWENFIGSKFKINKRKDLTNFSKVFCCDFNN